MREAVGRKVLPCESGFGASTRQLPDVWRCAANLGWKVDVLSTSESEVGGFREVIAQIDCDRVFAKLKYEAGVHRVQRVPATEAQGRIHTSTCTVAVMPEADEVDIQLRPEDLRIDVYRSSGKGGQSVNTTDSAVRITHMPSGLVVTCQDERSLDKVVEGIGLPEVIDAVTQYFNAELLKRQEQG